MSVKRSTNALTVKQKAEQVVESVKSTVLCAIKNAETDKLFNAEKVGEQYVAVLTLEADGSLNLNAVVDNNAALTIALAAHYNAQKAAAKATAE